MNINNNCIGFLIVYISYFTHYISLIVLRNLGDWHYYFLISYVKKLSFRVSDHIY